jgi:hypothetical protein
MLQSIPDTYLFSSGSTNDLIALTATTYNYTKDIVVMSTLQQEYINESDNITIRPHCLLIAIGKMDMVRI